MDRSRKRNKYAKEPEPVAESPLADEKTPAQ